MKQDMCHLVTVDYSCDCVGVSVSVAENTPSSAFIYAILSRDPDLGQEVEVSFILLSFMFTPKCKQQNTLLNFSMSKTCFLKL